DARQGQFGLGSFCGAKQAGSRGDPHPRAQVPARLLEVGPLRAMLFLPRSESDRFPGWVMLGEVDFLRSSTRGRLLDVALDIRFLIGLGGCVAHGFSGWLWDCRRLFVERSRRLLFFIARYSV